MTAAAAAAARRAGLMLRRVVPRCRPLVSRQQLHWTPVQPLARSFATTPASRNIAEKYREKLDRKAREEGLSNVDELKKAYADKIKKQRAADAAIAPPGLDKILSDEPAPRVAHRNSETAAKSQSPPVAESSPSTTPPPTPPPAPEAATKDGNPAGQVVPLSAIIDLSKARTLPLSDLTDAWRLHHASDPKSLCAIIPAATYKSMEALARRRPQFVLPVPHPEQGAEMHFMQWTFDAATGTSTVLFTQLAEYKARGEFAQPHTTVTHHPDLADDVGVVLMTGAVADNRGVKVADAQWLVMCLQRFYGGWDPAAVKGGAQAQGGGSSSAQSELVEWFGTGDERFSIERLMDEAEKLV